MKLLTSVLKDPQIQNYISEQEDSAFEFLKSNFSVNDIYEHITNNIQFYIEEDDLESSYENIKNVASSYTIRILNEAVNPDLADYRSGVDYIVKGFGSIYSKLLDFGFNEKDAETLRDAAISIKYNNDTNNEASSFINNLFNGDFKAAKQILSSNDVYSSKEAKSVLSELDQNSLLDKAARFFNRMGRQDLVDTISEVKDFIVQNPQYSIPAIVLGIIGCVGAVIGVKKLVKRK